MKIIQWIKDFINKCKTKKLNAPNFENIQSENIKIESTENISLNEKTIDKVDDNVKKDIFALNTKKELSKNDKVKQILKTIGCEKEIFLKITDFENLDIENFKTNLKLLTNFNFSKLQLSIILGRNPEIIYIQSDIFEKCIHILENEINDIDVVKNIIYTNPFVICDNPQIKEVINLLEEYNITKENINIILDDNSNILTLGIEKIKQSIEVIKQYFNSENVFLEEIINDPIIIGITNADVLAQYMSV